MTLSRLFVDNTIYCYSEREIFTTVCPDFVSDSVKILEDMIPPG